jgi:hypothetical protein
MTEKSLSLAQKAQLMSHCGNRNNDAILLRRRLSCASNPGSPAKKDDISLLSSAIVKRRGKTIDPFVHPPYDLVIETRFGVNCNCCNRYVARDRPRRRGKMDPTTLRVCSARQIALSLAALLLVVGGVSAAGMDPAEIAAWDKARSDRTNPPGPPDRVNVLVEIQAGADRGPVRAFATSAGGFVRYEYKTVLPGVISLRNIPMTALEGLERAPGVVRIIPDQYHERVINLDESTPLIRGLQDQITGAGLNADGTGVRVCVVDTGIDIDHIMYSDRIDSAAGYDFNNNDSNPEDDNGHGSHVAGIAVSVPG